MLDIRYKVEYSITIPTESRKGGECLSTVTKNVSRYIKENGFNLSKISRATGVPYSALYNSLFDSERKRSLRDDEFVAICDFLKINPMDFAEKKEVI